MPHGELYPMASTRVDYQDLAVEIQHRVDTGIAIRLAHLARRLSPTDNHNKLRNLSPWRKELGHRAPTPTECGPRALDMDPVVLGAHLTPDSPWSTGVQTH